MNIPTLASPTRALGVGGGDTELVVVVGLVHLGVGNQRLVLLFPCVAVRSGIRVSVDFVLGYHPSIFFSLSVLLSALKCSSFDLIRIVRGHGTKYQRDKCNRRKTNRLGNLV